VVGDEPFAVLLADDLMDPHPGQPSTVAQMVRLYEQEQASMVAVQDVPREFTRQYGIVSCTPYKDRLERMHGIVEKPKPEEAPSTLAAVGRYVLSGKIFSYLEKLGKGSGGEIQLTDGIAQLLQAEPVYAYRAAATRFDCGSKLGYLKASVALGLKHPEMGEEFAQYLKSL
jgi:UTP--glucose-1-phosphate uridylyltransferase